MGDRNIRGLLDSTFSRWVVVSLLTLLVGYLDYLTGPNVSMSAFYLLPLGMSAWQLGLGPALVVAVASVALWIWGNVVSGSPAFLNPALATWNGAVRLTVYVVVAYMVHRMRTSQAVLEQRVRERTARLESLQRDLLEISEREQRRIGQDLHDGLCQHLAATAFTCQSLKESLAEQNLAQADDALQVLNMVKEAVVLSRQSAKGLHPVEMGAEGLMLALEEFASATRQLFGVSCRFECDSPVLIRDEAVASHLFRIAQEATRNAVTHGRAGEILIALDHVDDGVELRVEDNGTGISRSPRTHKGMGLTIMKQRAAVIGASLDIGDRQKCGTVVCCVVPAFVLARNSHREPEGSKSLSGR